MSMSNRSGARCSKYSHVEGRFTLGLNTTKITNNAPDKSSLVLNFLQKINERICLSPLGVELGDIKDCHIWDLIVYWNGKVDSL